MVHISELGADRPVLNHPDEIVSAGQQVQATVLTVEPERRRIALTLNPGNARPSAEDMQSRPSTDGGSGLGSFGDLLQAQMANRCQQGLADRRQCPRVGKALRMYC